MPISPESTTPAAMVWPTEFYGIFEMIFGVGWGAYVKLNEFHDMNCESATIVAIDSFVGANRFWNSPGNQREFPENLVLVTSPLISVLNMWHAWELCHFGDPWWAMNAPTPVPDMVPCPEWYV